MRISYSSKSKVVTIKSSQDTVTGIFKDYLKSVLSVRISNDFIEYDNDVEYKIIFERISPLEYINIKRVYSDCKSCYKNRNVYEYTFSIPEINFKTQIYSDYINCYYIAEKIAHRYHRTVKYWRFFGDCVLEYHYEDAEYTEVDVTEDNETEETTPTETAETTEEAITETTETNQLEPEQSENENERFKGVVFADNEHKQMFFDVLGRMNFEQKKDPYRESLAYLITLDTACRQHIYDMYDFDERCIKPDCLDSPWQTSVSILTTLLAFNMFTGHLCWCPDNFRDMCTPSEIFCSEYAELYWQAMRIRYTWIG